MVGLWRGRARTGAGACSIWRLDMKRPFGAIRVTNKSSSTPSSGRSERSLRVCPSPLTGMVAWINGHEPNEMFLRIGGGGLEPSAGTDRWAALLSEFCDKRRKLVGAPSPPFVKAALFVGLTVGNAPVAHAGGVPRLATFRLEAQDHRHERLFCRLPCLGVGVGEDKPLILDDLEIDAAVRKLVALRVAHDNQVGSARPDVEFSKRRGVGQRREPLLEKLGICPCSEHFVARGIDDAGQHQLTVRSRGGVC